MDPAVSSAGPRPPQGRPQHRRAKSASVFKAIIPTKGQKQPASDKYGGQQLTAKDLELQYSNYKGAAQILPADHPHAGQQLVPSELYNPNSMPSSPRKSTDIGKPKMEEKYIRGKRSDSTTALHDEKDKKGHRSRREKSKDTVPKKSKSSTSLANLFKNTKPPKDTAAGAAKVAKDKENTTPPGSSSNCSGPLPIWEQFATRQDPFQDRCTTTRVPLNDDRSRLEEIKLYTPEEYSPGKQKDFFGAQQPTLGKKDARPKSVEVTSSTAKSLFHPISRNSSQSKAHSNEQRREPAKKDTRESKQPPSVSSSEKSKDSLAPKKGSRVMAAVATYNGKAKDAEMEALRDPKKIDSAFEAVLDSRNIPEPMRQKMRTLKSSVKVDFIRSHRVDGAQAPSDAKPESVQETKVEQKKSEKGRSLRSNGKDTEAIADGEELEDGEAPPKRSRPRSRTFTFNKGDSSPSKKHKGGRDPSSHRRDKSAEPSSLKSPSTTSLVSSGNSEGSMRSQKGSKPAVPGEFVTYLHTTPKPQDVEVGRLHKLRLLLRNETVAWVDAFIREGGMTEIIALLRRTMDIEWREEHEDALLHEALLCLKGLTTTDFALQKLDEVASALFPALLGMLFDKERKGPSEFTTRQVITNILFTHLSTAPPAILPTRARTILSYLEDPAPPEERRPMAFLTEMHRPRPYRVWNKEVVDVTKEVFWIFLHQLNVVSLPAAPGSTSAEPPKTVEKTPPPESALSKSSHSQAAVAAAPATPTATTTTTKTAAKDFAPERPTSSRAETAGFARHDDASYTTRHFPPPRPPVPAAPYVGGVEWDATNYLASHLDLLNGLVSSLPTRDERNELRTLLKASGWEKAMGNSLRTCKEKFYGAVHAGLRTWVAAAAEDGWPVEGVRFGLRDEGGAGGVRSVRSSPVKKKEALQQEAPRLEVPLLKDDLALGQTGEGGGAVRPADGWSFDV